MIKFSLQSHLIFGSYPACRSLIFRDVDVTDTGFKVLRRHHQMASHGTVYDMIVDPTMEVVVTVGQVTSILWLFCTI